MLRLVVLPPRPRKVEPEPIRAFRPRPGGRRFYPQGRTEVDRMRWKQFLTPVKSVTPDEARDFLASPESGDYVILDVRQPGEYREGHIAGARLIPLGDLSDRLFELDEKRPTLVYCAVGGRSRVAAQLMAGKGFTNVLNLSGGFKAWNGWAGFGDYDAGMELFSDAVSAQDAMEVALGMEAALEKFYEEMAGKVSDDEASKLFRRLSRVETVHKTAVADRYRATTGQEAPDPVSEVYEGGMTTEEYLERLGTDMEKPRDIVEFAMTVEAQAMDLYSRAAEGASDEDAKSFLAAMAVEEKGHLRQLGELMDGLTSEE